MSRKAKGQDLVQVQDEAQALVTHSDTDLAGCRRTRRSTTGGYTAYGTHLLKAWCFTQATVALSSAEAELYGLVRASAETLGMISLFKDLGQTPTGQVMGDASAALAIIARTGIGKIRHLDTNYLWVQEQSARGILKYGKVAGKENAGDLFTTPLTWEDISGHAARLNSEVVRGDDRKEIAVFGGGALREEVEREVDRWVAELDLLSAEVWQRGDLQSRTTKTSMRGGPSWEHVRARVTVDARTGEVIRSERSEAITRNTEHALVPEGSRDIVTALVYTGPAGQAKVGTKAHVPSDFRSGLYNGTRTHT